MTHRAILAAGVLAFGAALGSARALEDEFRPLFPQDSLEGWRVSDWSAIDRLQRVPGEPWRLQGGVLEGLGKRTWLYSEKEYGDFDLRFEWKIAPGANGGLGLRFPPRGDPAYTGMEIQMVDAERYYGGKARPEQVTGAVYDEIAPKRDASKPPGEWNRMEVSVRGSRLKVVLNGETVIDTDLAGHKKARQKRGPPLAERPRRGRIGFQNLNGRIWLRKIEIRMRDPR